MQKQSRPKTANSQAISEKQVLNYLLKHPEFLNKYPEVWQAATSEERALGENVVDFQQVLIKRLQEMSVGQEQLQLEILSTTRNNLNIQHRIHEATLTLLAAQSFDNFVELLTVELPLILDIDIIALGFEGKRNLSLDAASNLRSLKRGYLDKLFQPNMSVLLRPSVEGDAQIYGFAAELIRSDALLRLDLDEVGDWQGVLAFGSKKLMTFHPNQGIEFLTFLTHVVELCLIRWLEIES